MLTALLSVNIFPSLLFCSVSCNCQVSLPIKFYLSIYLLIIVTIFEYCIVLYIAVIISKSGRCHNIDSPTPSDMTTGILASITSSVCGTPQSPWVIEVKPGQRINVTLLDFTSAEPTSSSDKGIRSSTVHTAVACQVFAVIKELSPVKTATICGGLFTNVNRERHVYQSDSSKIEIRMMVLSLVTKDAGQFLIRYRGRFLYVF